MNKKSQNHPFHLVDISPWPVFSAASMLFITFGTILYLNSYGARLMKLGGFLILIAMFLWWRDVTRESTFEGYHTKDVQFGIKVGTLLFILSEFMLFFGFFFSFFYFSLNPSIFIGGVWPPAYLNVLNPLGIPLLNTIVLVSSGVTVTLSHHSIVYGSKTFAQVSLIATLILAAFFSLLQLIEYFNSPFSIYTSVYGSIFFFLTGFHGLHVFIGTTFLLICLLRLNNDHFTKEHHVGFEAASWYWHFVDAVWIFLYLSLYCWGS